MITYSPKVNRVAPNVVMTDPRPALPPKPSKMSPTEQPSPVEASASGSGGSGGAAPTAKTQTATFGLQSLNINDNLPIKAKPLTIRKQPLFEQPRLKSSQSSSNGQQKPPPVLQNQRKSETPVRQLADSQQDTTSPQPSPSSESSADETDRMVVPPASQQETTSTTTSSSASTTITTTSNIKERTGNGKPKLARRVSFDPLALLLDASLEGELELVKKTAMQVANPSAANDEGITALHNAICAGHFDIVK